MPSIGSFHSEIKSLKFENADLFDLDHTNSLFMSCGAGLKFTSFTVNQRPWEPAYRRMPPLAGLGNGF